MKKMKKMKKSKMMKPKKNDFIFSWENRFKDLSIK